VAFFGNRYEPDCSDATAALTGLRVYWCWVCCLWRVGRLLASWRSVWDSALCMALLWAFGVT
jgi:hypothetical protein